MKKILLSASLIITTASFAQTAFWTESFGSGCNRGQLANNFATTNGPWTVASTGTNDTYANQWYVSATASGEGAQNCSDNCFFNSIATNQSLHVSNVNIVIPNFVSVGADTGSSYFSGGLCGFGVCALTDRRAESPSINTVNRNNVGISFMYYENGDGANDDATLWYSPDGGITWSQIDALAKISASCAGMSGLWTEFSMALPPSASNNPNIKIGFRWVNNDDGTGTDPSFAVDDVTILENFPLAVPSNSLSAINLVQQQNSVVVYAPTNAWQVNSVVDVAGREIQVNIVGNEIVFAQPAGMYFIRMEMNGEESVHRVIFAN